jgi:hypothetical protein
VKVRRGHLGIPEVEVVPSGIFQHTAHCLPHRQLRHNYLAMNSTYSKIIRNQKKSKRDKKRYPKDNKIKGCTTV